MFERNMDECRTRLGEDVVAVDELPGDVDPAPVLVLEVGTDQQLGVDRDRVAVMHEEAAGDGREAIPRRQQAAGLVERGMRGTRGWWCARSPGSPELPRHRPAGDILGSKMPKNGTSQASRWTVG